MLLAMGLLMACGSENDVEQTPEKPNPEVNPDDPLPDERDDSTVVDMLPQTRTIELTQEQRVFAKKNNDFTFNLYRAIRAAQQEKSIIASPLSVTYVMGMLNDGAAGKTAEAMQSRGETRAAANAVMAPHIAPPALP